MGKFEASESNILYPEGGIIVGHEYVDHEKPHQWEKEVEASGKTILPIHSQLSHTSSLEQFVMDARESFRNLSVRVPNLPDYDDLERLSRPAFLNPKPLELKELY